MYTVSQVFIGAVDMELIVIWSRIQECLSSAQKRQSIEQDKAFSKIPSGSK